MSDLLVALERAERRTGAAGSPPSLDRFVTYRSRRVRNQRIAAAVVTISLMLVAIAGGVEILRSSGRRSPANPDGVPSAQRLEVLPEIPADLHVLPDLRSQVVVAAGSYAGIPWSLRTDEDASCAAFVREDSGRGFVGTDDWGLIGPGGATESCELDALGDLVAIGTGKTDGPLGFFVFGTVSRQVDAIEVSIDGFGPIQAVVLPAPDEAGADVRYFVAVSGQGVTHGLVGSITAIGADERVLATYRFPSGADRPGGVSAPMQLLWSVRWSGEWEIGVWRNGGGDWCFGEVGGEEGYGGGYGWLPPQGAGCTTREHLFDGIREGDIALADAVVLTSRGFIYQAWGTTSDAVATVRLESPGGRVVSIDLHAADGFPDMGKVFAFARRQDPADGFGGRLIALDAAGRILEEVSLPALTPVDEWVSTWSPVG